MTGLIVAAVLSLTNAPSSEIEIRRMCADRISDMPVGADPLLALTPQPKRIVRSCGFLSGLQSVNVQVVSGSVADAPERTARESYRLGISADGVTITAPDARGERYARVTLEQLSRLSDGRIPCCEIVDWPDYPWRGFMHDCGRNFLDVCHVKKIIDLMALYKLNLFHWHLTDYYGWRLESKRYPMLQAPWAFRRHLGKFYTQSDFREVVAYAGEKGITVMPELDVPGHTLAFRRGLGIEFMAEKKVKGIVADLIDELCELAAPEFMPYVHIGTDEARSPYEQVPDSYCPYWAERVWANGRMPWGWTPGKRIVTQDGLKAGKMVWGSGFSPETDDRLLDTVGCYIGSRDPFTFLNAALSLNLCAWEVPIENKMGGVICSWHDDYLGEDTSRVFENCNLAPAVVFYSDLLWKARTDGQVKYAVKLPEPGTRDYDCAAALENRIVAQRDKVASALGLPFNYVRQTGFRWRISDGDGRVVAKDIAQAAITISKCGGHRLVADQSYLQKASGVAVVETWIRSPDDKAIGAWIGFTRFGRSGGRDHGLPEAGEWGRSPGVRVEVNDQEIAAPNWGNPGLKYLMRHPEESSSCNISETPFTNEEYFMREPTPLSLNRGWNHVKITVPKHIGDEWGYDWTSLFVPVTMDRCPHEVAGLEYSSDPH